MSREHVVIECTILEMTSPVQSKYEMLDKKMQTKSTSGPGPYPHCTNLAIKLSIFPSHFSHYYPSTLHQTKMTTPFSFFGWRSINVANFYKRENRLFCLACFCLVVSLEDGEHCVWLEMRNTWRQWFHVIRMKSFTSFRGPSKLYYAYLLTTPS